VVSWIQTDLDGHHPPRASLRSPFLIRLTVSQLVLPATPADSSEFIADQFALTAFRYLGL